MRRSLGTNSWPSGPFARLYLFINVGQKTKFHFEWVFDTDLHSVSWSHWSNGPMVTWVAKCKLTCVDQISKKPCTFYHISQYDVLLSLVVSKLGYQHGADSFQLSTSWITNTFSAIKERECLYGLHWWSSLVYLLRGNHLKWLVRSILVGMNIHGVNFTTIAYQVNVRSWWRHQMETFSALLALCAGISPVTDEFPLQRPVTRSFDVFFDLRLNKSLIKQMKDWWFQTPSRSLWRHYNVIHQSIHHLLNAMFENGQSNIHISKSYLSYEILADGFVIEDSCKYIRYSSYKTSTVKCMFD